jgi:excisionase family DNA binding protein
MKKPVGELLNTEEVAKRLNITRQHASALIREGKLPATKVGRDWIVNSNDLPIAESRPGRGRPKKKKTDDEDE